MARNKFAEIEQERGQPMRDILIGMFKLYGLDEQPQQRVAAELGVSQPTVSQWIKACQLRRVVKLVESAPSGPVGAPIDRSAAEKQLLDAFAALEAAS
jgi:DNA-binding transcriptional regulator LsrR (DeoR family)